MNRGTIWVAVIAVLVALAIGAGYFYFGQGQEQTFCTMEAKQCPDGSYVGRSGPRCEFAECPADAYPGWKTQGEGGAFFRYPETLARYTVPVDWPPQVQVLDQPFGCTEGGSPEARAGGTVRRTVDDREYCVTEVREGAAGTIYSMYAYAFPKDGKTAILTFSVRRPQCGNYPDAERAACEAERGAFDLDGVLDRIAQSFRPQ